MKRNITPNLPCVLAWIALFSASFVSMSEAINHHHKPNLIITGGHVVVNDDDGNDNQKWDFTETPTLGNPMPDKGLTSPKTLVEQNEPKLQEFTFTATPTHEPGTLVITANNISPFIKLWKDPRKNEAFDLAPFYPISIDSHAPIVFYVEGLKPTPAFDTIIFTATYAIGEKKAEGLIKFGVTRADIDIDSNNDGIIEADDTEAPGTEDERKEDEIELSHKPEYPGKILLESTAAIDANGVAASVMQSAFAPLRVTLHPPFSPGTAKVKFTYPASVPSTPANKRGLRLWKANANGNGSVFIAPDGEIPWNDIAVSGATDATLYVEYVEIPGSAKTSSKEDILITITITDPDGAEKGHTKILGTEIPLPGKESPDGVTVSLLPVEIVPDWNRDGMINDEDSGKATDEEPFVFWINDDDDGNDEPHFGDVPGQGVDNADNVVNGERDLVDFFPVQLRIKAMLEVFPEDEYTYKISHPTGAFHFIEMPDVHPDSSPEAQGAGSYLRNQTMADDAMARPMKDTAGDGSELSIEYLAAVRNDIGVLLFESTSATNQSFELIVTKNGGGEVARIPRALPVEMVDNPESMYWRLNIRPAAAGQAPEAVEEPTSAKFKASRKDQWFVFCHGYNVSKEAARGWNAEVFKRLHQEGSDAKFVGVSWEGNQGQFDASLAFGMMLTPDYWRNVYNAFSSSHALATEINGLTGSDKSKTVIAAHSLGNMVVSSAICDHGLQAGHYFMCNSAVPREAYSAGYVANDRNKMRNPRWQAYPSRLWSSEWKNLYADEADEGVEENDGRNKLTWEDRFKTLVNSNTNLYNYYSTGEDVAKPPVEGQEPNDIEIAVVHPSAWVSQEMNKGFAVKAVLNGLATGNWSAGGGWGFNLDHYAQYRPNPLGPPVFPLPDTSAITEGQLRANPFFKPFTKLEPVVNGGGANPAADGTDITTPAGSAHASEYVIRAWMLAHEIPSLSLPTASGNLAGVIMGTDMENEFKTGNWGNEKWTHSAMREKDPTEVYKLYKDMCDKGKLRKP